MSRFRKSIVASDALFVSAAERTGPIDSGLPHDGTIGHDDTTGGRAVAQLMFAEWSG